MAKSLREISVEVVDRGNAWELTVNASLSQNRSCTTFLQVLVQSSCNPPRRPLYLRQKPVPSKALLIHHTSKFALALYKVTSRSSSVSAFKSSNSHVLTPTSLLEHLSTHTPITTTLPTATSSLNLGTGNQNTKHRKQIVKMFEFFETERLIIRAFDPETDTMPISVQVMDSVGQTRNAPK